ncbi:unnamed protein product [Rotaria sp. Silwood2]|nr:unnamed protein product [Rotaria sp. Silwood2]CAF3060591.1 unnamed protein product [Rotaria sp. Silwood2]CAF4087444.1 unnamed protein product [Rotaria sp. Silwood2]CAF4386133.1 unnamed protein product [Rotaria sp. Silwood2]
MYFILFLFVMIIFDGGFASSNLQQESEATVSKASLGKIEGLSIAKAGVFNRSRRQTFTDRTSIAILMPEGGPWGEEKH